LSSAVMLYGMSLFYGVASTVLGISISTIGACDQPRVRVVLDVRQAYGRTLRQAFRAVPLPAGARPLRKRTAARRSGR